MISKRTALKATVAAGAVTVFSGFVPGLGEAMAQRLRVRRSVNNMALDDPDLATYRDFVGIMRARPATQRVSWIGFANQHGDENDFKYCPHGDWYFLPWHRGFVEMYEKAAAALTQNPKFAMPYWDWTTLRTLPTAFTDKMYKGKPNPLYVPGQGDDPSMIRNALTGGNALTDALVGPDVIKKIYAETVYEAFGTSRSVDRSDPNNPVVQNNLDPKWVPMGGGNQGILESTPHNNVHNNIGAFMPQSNSPRDPIFFMHHGNIDRIWAHWNALGRKNSTDPLWLNMPFTDNYITPDGKFYGKPVNKLLSTTALGYTYDDMPKPDNKKVDPQRLENMAALLNPAAKPKIKAPRFKTANTRSARVGAPLQLAVPLSAEALKPAIAPMTEKSAPREVVAIISDIKIGDNGRAIRVFVNRETVNLDVPESDPHFVTTLSFLKHGKGGSHAGHTASHSTIVNLTDTLQNLTKTKTVPTDKITVQLLAVPAPGVATSAVGEVKPGSIEIAIV
jgi:tyrosinase